MNRVLLLTILAVVGCKKAVPDVPAPTATPEAITTPIPAAPIKKLIKASNPEFDTMLADFKTDPKTKKFEREIVTFVMTVEAVKEIDKQKYLVTGKGVDVNLVCTFILQPHLTLNRQVKDLVPGDKVTYWAEPTIYKPGTPPTITSLSGSIMLVENVKK